MPSRRHFSPIIPFQPSQHHPNFTGSIPTGSAIARAGLACFSHIMAGSQPSSDAVGFEECRPASPRRRRVARIRAAADSLLCGWKLAAGGPGRSRHCQLGDSYHIRAKLGGCPSAPRPRADAKHYCWHRFPVPLIRFILFPSSDIKYSSNAGAMKGSPRVSKSMDAI